jgi:hypothetical protein
LTRQRSTPQEHEQTLAAARKKVAQRREQLAAHPSEEAFHQLLDELAETTPPLIYLDRREEVLATLREAIGVCRTLEATYPGKGAFRLALLLDSQSTLQNSSGQSEEALASVQEAVSLLRPLMERRPELVAPHLVHTLIGLGIIQRYVGQAVEGLAPLREAVELSLAQLAMGLERLALEHGEPRQQEATLASVRDPVEVLRRLAGKRPELFLPPR